MPKIKLLEDPAIAALVETKVASALKEHTRDMVRSVKSHTADHVALHSDKATITAVKNHGKDIVSAIKGPTE